MIVIIMMMMAATIWQSEKPHYTKKPDDTIMQLKSHKNKQALTRLWQTLALSLLLDDNEEGVGVTGVVGSGPKQRLTYTLISSVENL